MKTPSNRKLYMIATSTSRLPHVVNKLVDRFFTDKMLGCVVATVGICIIAAVWYHDKIPSGRVWMSRNYPGKTADEIGKGLRSALGISIVNYFFLSLLLRFMLINYFHVKSIVDGVKITVGLSCLTTFVELPHCLFSRHSVDAFIVDQMFNLMSLALAGVSIAYFG